KDGIRYRNVTGVQTVLFRSYLLDHYGNDDIKEKFLPYVCSTGELPLYEGATFLTERQGGSDVGANIVKAIRDGDQYRIYGEKYLDRKRYVEGNSRVCIWEVT